MTGYENCRLCPRGCGIDRTRHPGPCGGGSLPRLARAALHFWEEPCISGEGENAPGSGAVFFSGCPLRCCFCQNYEISEKNNGKEVSEERLSAIFLRLQQEGAANLNLVTGTHYIPSILRALSRIRNQLLIPVVWNCGGYETIESVEMLEGSVQGDVGMTPPVLEAYETLHAFLFERVYFNPVAKAEEGKAKQAIGALFEHFMQKPQELPQEYQNYMEQDGLERVVLDYISGMTDRYCIARFEEIFVPKVWR